MRTDEKTKVAEILVHLARLAIGGEKREVEAYVRRLGRTLAKDYPEAAQSMSELVASGVATRAAGDRDRSHGTRLLPVDVESRLELLRVEPVSSMADAPVLVEGVRAQIEQVILERQHVEKLAAADLDPSRTILFTGPPGVGKTLTAHWIAHRLNKPLFTLDLASVMSSLLGKTGTNLKTVLEYAKNNDCVLLLDEFDAVAKRRNDDSEVGELKRLVTVILQEIDLWPANRLLIAATNHGELLDPAVWRRFDAVVDFPNPSAEYLERLVQQELGDDVPLPWQKAIATIYEGRSFSDVARHLRSVRRQALLASQPIADKLIEFVAAEMQMLPKSALKRVGAQLENAGLTQRHVAEITGLSRDTIRKARMTEGSDNG